MEVLATPDNALTPKESLVKRLDLNILVELMLHFFFD